MLSRISDIFTSKKVNHCQNNYFQRKWLKNKNEKYASCNDNLIDISQLFKTDFILL